MKRLLLVATALLLAVPAASATTWHFPEAAYAGHPMHMAVLAPAAPQGSHGPADMPVSIMLDNQPMFWSDSIHEDDGYHTFLFTPPRPGMLSASIGDATMTDFVGEPRTGDPARHTQRVGVAVLPVLQPHGARYDVNHTKDLRLEWGATGHDPVGFVSSGIGHGQPVTPLFDLRDADGRLIASAIPRYFHAAWMGIDSATTAGTARAYVLPAYYSPEPLFGQAVERAWSGTAPPPLFAPGPPPGDACGDRLMADPKSITPDGFTWQEHTDLRFAPPPGVTEPPIVYQMWRHTPGGPPLLSYGQRAADPFGTFTVGAPSPGVYHLTMRTAGEAPPGCSLLFTILPGPEATPGRVAITPVVSDDRNVTLTLAASRDGAPLPHYAFETRVFRLPTDTEPGLLLWAGKLHGPEGTATAELYHLAPGTYRVHTYPSPEDLGTPPVATDDPRGFAATFTIAQTAFVDDVPDPVDPETAPGSSFAFAILLLGLLLLSLRRTKAA